MSSHYHSTDKKGMSSSSSSSSSSTSSGRSRSSSSSSSRSRSNSPDTRRRHRREREREHSKLSTTTKSRYYDDDERSNSSNSNNSRERYQMENNQQQPKYKDERYKDSIAYNSKTTTTSSVDYNSIRSDKSSESTTSGGGRSSIGSDKNATTKISGNYEKIPEAPAPPKISKSTILFGKPGTVTKPGIQMKLIPPKAKTETTKKITVASAFNNESDDEVEEEMPPECRMRMRNIGRDTPTSSGPNSFGKTKQGFVDTKKVFERSLREACAD